MQKRDQQSRIAQFVRQWWDELGENPPADEVYPEMNWPSIHGQAPSLERMLYFVRQACPDASFFIEEMLTDEEETLVRWQMRGTDSNGFQERVPTQRRITLIGMQKIYEEQGQLLRAWSSADLLSLLLQLGFICLPQQPRTGARWHYADTY